MNGAAGSGSPPKAMVWLLALAAAVAARADPAVETETRSAQARIAHGVTGKGVVVAILDRGIDWTHPDFRNADGSTRIAYIFDMTDNTGAAAAGNSYGAGTIYTRAQINAALAGGPALATRDAVGHGTATAGNCCGNGRASNGTYTGVAPESTLIVVKFTSDGAPAHGTQPAEAAFYQPDLFPKAVDFAVDKARELGMPLVMLANFGSIGDRNDGGDPFAKKIDATVGAGKPGLVFVTGTGDDGGRDNHAAAEVAAGQSVQVPLRKGRPGRIIVSFWYPAAGRLTASIATPTANFGPYAPPENNTGITPIANAEFTYGHNGAIFYDNTWRQLYFLLDGPAGIYTVTLQAGPAATRFDAFISPATFFLNDENRFLSLVRQEKTIWSGAAARNNIAPNSYVFNPRWRGLDGVSYAVTNEGAIGDLWRGSSVGPTLDGRLGVDLAAPGEHTVTTYGATSYWATSRGNSVADGGGLYGVASAVSAAAPVLTGAIALMLQKNPTLDAAAVKSALQRSARADAFTGTVPNARWGHGKLDVNAALAAVPLIPIANSVSDCLFRWAEGIYPQFFSPAGAFSDVFPPYYFRFYRGTGNYLAVSSADNHVWVLGPSFATVPLDVGHANNFLGPAGC
jgi:subtilisin family serine protease